MVFLMKASPKKYFTITPFKSKIPNLIISSTKVNKTNNFILRVKNIISEKVTHLMEEKSTKNTKQKVHFIMPIRMDILDDFKKKDWYTYCFY